MNLANKMVVFIGAGNMAEALVRGLLSAKVVMAAQVIVTDVNTDRLEYMERTYGVDTEQDNAVAAAKADIVVLAVKPQQMGAVLGALKVVMDGQLVVSIAAGITTVRLQTELGGRARVVRVMPNTPALVGAGAAGVCAGRFATEEDVQTAEAILQAVGITVRVPEGLMDAVTAVSGSGPAYVFYMVESLVAAGVQVGLSAEVARQLAVQTVVGAGQLLASTGEDPAELRRKVTSPGGTTSAAIKVMETRRLAEIYAAAVAAAVQRARELADS